MKSEPGPIEHFLTEDHERLDALLSRALARPDAIDEEAYAQFRRGLLRHIAMEEKVLLPTASELRGGESLPVATALRRDHARIARLLLPPLTHEIGTRLRQILAAHNRLEEGPGGLYALCDALAGAEAEAVVERLRSVPEVPASRTSDSSLVRKVVGEILDGE
jgi:hypothetical protein